MFHHGVKEQKSLADLPCSYCLQCKNKEIRIKSLEKELAATVDKQHEAMGRALQLAERNKLLERELKDIDHMALEIEAECQSKVKHNLKNIDILQSQLKQKIDENKKLEEILFNVKSKIRINEQELVNLKTEKKLLEENFNVALVEKKNLHDKINNFVLIEKNLNTKVFKLMETNKTLHQQILAMEEKLMDVFKEANKMIKDKPKKFNPVLGLPSSKFFSPSKTNSSFCKLARENNNCCMRVENRIENKNCFHTCSNSIPNFFENDINISSKQVFKPQEQFEDLDWKTNILKVLEDKEKEIAMLRQTKVEISEGCNFNKPFTCSSKEGIKELLEKLEKDRDLALIDLSRLQEEKDALKDKIKLLTESHVAERSRLERISKENEERIRRLESERRELISSQSSQRLALANAEEKLDECQEKNRNSTKDLSQMTANYNQLKILQEQTDRSLTEMQDRLIQVDDQLRQVSEKARELQKSNSNLENEICLLKKENLSLKSNLASTEKEKDGLLINLDEKTEKVALLEDQLKNQQNYALELKEKFSLLEKKFEFAENERTNRELGLQMLQGSLERSKEEIRSCELQNDALIRENRRLQDDLASASKDCMAMQKEWEREKQEVENLKKQLQQYFKEVKKAEELLSKKECERNQMLEHFRCLSLEATALESNNHTLESTVENTKSELISANTKIIDLEQQADVKDGLLSNYEKQIAELTSQIAEMELKFKVESESKARAEEDLFVLRNLCSTIDDQKEILKKEADNCNAEKFHLASEVKRLGEEYEGLSQKLAHERSLSQTLEKSLSNSRQETLEHKITNKDLRDQVQHLKQKVNDLTQKWETESQEVKKYQSQCADLCQQVGELRREVTNSRFEQAKVTEGCRRKFAQNIPREELEEAKLEENSPRNVPPLPLREDSDATTSFESDEDFVKFLFEKTSNSFRKTFWGLSPLSEKMVEKHLEFGVCPADTASELSSLPEDGRSKMPQHFDDFTACPTYSVRSASDLDEEQHRSFSSAQEREALEEGMQRQKLVFGPSEPHCLSDSISKSNSSGGFGKSEFSPNSSLGDEGSRCFFAADSVHDRKASDFDECTYDI